GVGTGCHLPGDRRGPGAVPNDLPRRAGEAQEPARPLQSARRDRRIPRQALPGPPETAARLPHEAEPSRPAVGDERSLRVLPGAPEAPGVRVRVAGAQRVAGKSLRPLQADEAQPRTGRGAGLFLQRLTCERPSRSRARGRTTCETSTWRSLATS